MTEFKFKPFGITPIDITYKNDPKTGGELIISPVQEEKPRYIHDCDTCVFLGQYKEYDLYFCSNEPTIICRYSDDGPDYSSGLVFGVVGPVERGLFHSTEALFRAMKNPQFRTLINKYFKSETSFPERYEAFQELSKIRDTVPKNWLLLIGQLKYMDAYLEDLLKREDL